eukprot:1658753-Prorocentrum_lima.AAC.1
MERGSPEQTKRECNNTFRERDHSVCRKQLVGRASVHLGQPPHAGIAKAACKRRSAGGGGS